MEIAVACGVFGVACILMAGALGKSTAPGPFVSMLEAVGVAPAFAARCWWIVPGAELAAAVALLTGPGRWPAQLLTCGVFTCFATVGLIAVCGGRTIRCACFGGRSSVTLGWRQVVQLFPVVALLALLHRYDPSWGVQQGLGLTTAALACAAAALGWRAVPVWREIRGMRVSLRTTRLEVRRLALEGDDG